MIRPAEGFQMIIRVAINVSWLAFSNKQADISGIASEQRCIFSIGRSTGASEEPIKVEACALQMMTPLRQHICHLVKSYFLPEGMFTKCAQSDSRTTTAQWPCHAFLLFLFCANERVPGGGWFDPQVPKHLEMWGKRKFFFWFWFIGGHRETLRAADL